jgi:exonuclease SbcD
MKILHTADWHVGRTLRGRSRAEEHRGVLAEIVGIARDEAVDLVIIAGDLFDSAAPTPEAEELVYDALLGLARTGPDIIVTAGNHDNPLRLKAVRPLLSLTRIHTVPFPARRADGGVIDVTTRSGERARVAVLPFLSQRGIIRAEQLMGQDADDHVQQYGDRCRSIIAHLTEEFDGSRVNIVVSHLAVVGGEMGGGERAAHTVFDYHVSPQIFPATAHYVALGHLHRRQSIPGGCPIWYCGSPLQLDFGEAEAERGVLVVEASAGRPALVRTRSLASGRRLRTIRGTLAQLEAMKDDVGDAFLRVVVHESPCAGLADEVRELFANAVDVSIEHDDDGGSTGRGEDDRSWSRAPGELFEQYLRDRGVEDPRLLALFNELLEEVG